MRVPAIVINEVKPGTPPDLIELAAADLASFRAVCAIRSNGSVRFVPTLLRPGGADLSTASVPGMVVAVGDARGDEGIDDLLALKWTAALGVAVVAVESLPGSVRPLAELARRFEAVLPVLVARGADAEAALGRAVRAVTAFATADCISMPVDEVYPIFVGAGRMTSGHGEGKDVASATAMALADAGLTGGARFRRVLLHLETTAVDLRDDLSAAVGSLRTVMRFESFHPTASVDGGGWKSVSLIAAAAL